MKRIICLLIVLSLATGLVTASDSTQVNPYAPMGAPDEMEQIKPLIGEWDVLMKMQMSPDAEWTESTGECTYELILDGCAVRQTYSSEGGGMSIKGGGIICYNRTSKKWQATWLDNMSASLSVYEGGYENGQMVVYGEETYGGQTFKVRNSTFDIKDDSFRWQSETSYDGGKTWTKNMDALYTRKK